MRGVTRTITPVCQNTKYVRDLGLEIVLVGGWHGGSDIVVGRPSREACQRVVHAMVCGWVGMGGNGMGSGGNRGRRRVTS